MTAALGWYLVVQLLGAIAFVLARPCCRGLADSGYTLSKSLGVLLCGVTLWLGTALGLLRNEPGGAALVVVAMAVAATAVGVSTRRASPRSFESPRPRLHVLLAAEGLFLVAFGGWCLVRSLDPAVNHTEQPMDLMLLTATATSPAFPPEDSWLAGYPVSYYYLGYWLVSTLGHLTGQPPQVAYTLGQASWLGLLVLGCFGLGFNLLARPADPSGTSRDAVLAGGLAATAVAFMGNLHLPAEWLGRWLRGEAAPFAEAGWWWWRSSRVVQDVDLRGDPIEVITEFPFFSYFLGDNHPHLLSMPFVVVAVTLALGVYRASAGLRHPETAAHGASRRSSGAWHVPTCLGLAALVCGALIPLNTWDAPASLLILLVALTLSSPSRGARGSIFGARLARDAGVVIVTLLAVSVPYLVTAQSQVRGLLPNLFHPTPLAEIFVMFGSLAPGLLLALGLGWLDHRPGRRPLGRLLLTLFACSSLWLIGGAWWASRSGAGQAWIAQLASGLEDPLAVSMDRWLSGWPVLAIVLGALAVLLAVLLARASDPATRGDGSTFALLLAGVGLMLVLVPELVYVHDDFGTRMNTVFKLYYQAWLFLGVSTSVTIVLAWRRGGALRAASVVAVAGLASGLVYPTAALATGLRPSPAESRTLDALAFLAREAPDELAAIDWVREHARPGARIAQAPGDSYRADHSRLSAVTGRPTLLGWQGHQRQWRGRSFEAMADGRIEALVRIYTPSSADGLRRELDRWHIDFVYLGPVERVHYRVTPEHEAVLADVMELVIEHGTVRLYRRRG